MSETSKRDEWDQHNRDEAKERAAQQEAAGPMHAPVPTEPYASLSGSPGAPNPDLDRAGVFDEYERAMASERTAWLAVRDLASDEGGIGAWNTWRDAVERTQQAARSVLNYQAGRSIRN